MRHLKQSESLLSTVRCNVHCALLQLYIMRVGRHAVNTAAELISKPCSHELHLRDRINFTTATSDVHRFRPHFDAMQYLTICHSFSVTAQRKGNDLTTDRSTSVTCSCVTQFELHSHISGSVVAAFHGNVDSLNFIAGLQHSLDLLTCSSSSSSCSFNKNNDKQTHCNSKTFHS